MNELNLKQLTNEQISELKTQLKAEETAMELQKKEDKQAYNNLKEEVVFKSFLMLEKLAESLNEIKSGIFSDFAILLDLKQQIYTISDEQMEKQGCHSFTAGNKTIMLGQNITDGWNDDIATAGIARVNDWLTSKTTSDNKVLVDMVRDLLRPSKDGVLKANRVLELSKRAAEIGDKELIEAVDILREAYRPKKTTSFVRAKFRNEQGIDQWLTLSM